MWRFLKKLDIELPYDPAIPLLGIHTEGSNLDVQMYRTDFGLCGRRREWDV